MTHELVSLFAHPILHQGAEHVDAFARLLSTYSTIPSFAKDLGPEDLLSPTVEYR